MDTWDDRQLVMECHWFGLIKLNQCFILRRTAFISSATYDVKISDSRLTEIRRHCPQIKADPR